MTATIKYAECGGWYKYKLYLLQRHCSLCDKYEGIFLFFLEFESRARDDADDEKNENEDKERVGEGGVKGMYF